MESKFSGSLPEIVHKGKCVKDPGGGPFCVLCGAFSGQMEASEVSGLEIGQWHQLQRYMKLLNYTLVVLGFLPVAFIFLDNIYGWTGLSYFDYYIPSRRGPNFNDKYIDFLTPMYLLFIATMIVNWSYIDRRYIQAVGKYPSSGLIAMKLVVYWVSPCHCGTNQTMCLPTA